MANHQVTKKHSGKGGFLSVIEEQRVSPTDHAAVDKIVGFQGQGSDAAVDTRVEDNLLRAVKAYAKVQHGNWKKPKPQSLEALLQRGYHLQQRLVAVAKKIQMYGPRLYFKIDAKAEPILANMLVALCRKEVLLMAFKMQEREAPSALPDIKVAFIGLPPRDAGESFLQLLSAPKT